MNKATLPSMASEATVAVISETADICFFSGLGFFKIISFGYCKRESLSLSLSASS